ncbi:MAG: DUF3379 family protein [Gammaproteobacteria bacterium]
MIQCKRFQKQFSAAPAVANPVYTEHIEHCAECAAFARQIMLLQKRLLAVMEVQIPASLQQRLQEIPRRERKRSLRNFSLGTLALAASLITGIGLYRFGWLHLPAEPSLNEVVYEHIIHEPQALNAVSPLKQAIVNTTLKDFGVTFADAEFGEVLYVTLCPIGDTHGLHLVVRGRQGPVTLLFMPTKSIAARTPFDQGEFAGYIEPAEVGLVAIVGEKGETLERYEHAVKYAVHWL